MRFTKNSKLSRGYLAYTLSEVLITLGIIGLVAEMTIPTLVSDINDQAQKNTLKVVYSQLLQATISLEKENGDTLRGLWGHTDNHIHSEQMYAVFRPALNVVKSCPNYTGGNGEGCWPPVATKQMTSGANDETFHNWPGVILANGASVTFQISGDRTDRVYNRAKYDSIIGIININTNGAKKPNTFGKDVFRVFVPAQNGLIPYGSVEINTVHDWQWESPTTCQEGGTGRACTAKALMGEEY